MGFSVHVNDPHHAPRASFKGSQGANSLVVIAVVFAAFCVFDYSSYGYGWVSDALGQSQRWVQYMVGQFRLKM